MEFLKAQVIQIGEQLRGMSVSQKIAIVLLLVILAAGMYGLIRWGGQSEWMPLLDQSFTADQLQRISGELMTLGGIQTKVEGDRLLVRGDDDRRRQLIAVLAQRGALPRDTSMGYAALIRENSVFVGDRSRVWMEHRGLESELSGVLRKFQGVRDAHVFIEVPQQRGFGAKATCSRASVHVTLDEGASLDKQRIMAIANFVTGAVSGLDSKDVKITDGARSYRAPDVTGELPTELLDIQRQAEEHHTQKIYDQLRYIPGVLVNVHAILQTADEQIQEKKLGAAVVDQEMTKSEETTSPSAAAGPGVRPNQGRALAESAGGGSNTREETDTSLRGERDARMQTTLRRPGYVEKLSAAVNVPKSYLERILGQQPGDAAADKTIDKIAAVELPKIKALVKPLINATTDDQVVVNWYYDIPPEQKAATESAPAGWMAAAKVYGPQVGLGLLATVSLLAVMRIAKKAQASIAAAGERAGARPAWAGPATGATGDRMAHAAGGAPRAVGETQDLDGVMVGHEVDANTVRVQQIARQIGQMIKEDPVAAAGIVQHWLAEEK
jgi:flagellar biosynthesis/type III secretory pathway M-ring protein FliF/YscJ